MKRNLFSLVAVGVLMGGCSSEPTLHPAQGTVTKDGKPVTAGGLIFFLESGAWNERVVNANVNADGTFTVETSYTGVTATTIKPGAPVGRYKVFYHPPGDGQKVGTEIELDERVTIQAGSNELTIDVPNKKTVGSYVERDAATTKTERPAPKP
jgi:hypothetical protein